MQMDLRDLFHSRERRMEDDMSAAMSPLPAAVPDVSRPRRAGQTPREDARPWPDHRICWYYARMTPGKFPWPSERHEANAQDASCLTGDSVSPSAMQDATSVTLPARQDTVSPR